MNNIQKLIEETEADGLQAHREFQRTNKDGDAHCLWHQGYYVACKQLVEKLTLLLNSETQTTVKKPEA